MSFLLNKKHKFRSDRCYLKRGSYLKPDRTNGRTVLCFSSISRDKRSADRASVARWTWFQWCRPAVVWPRVTSPKATCLRGRVQKRRAFRFVRPDPTLTNRVCVGSKLRLIGETSLHIKLLCKLTKHVDTRIGFIPTGGQNVNSERFFVVVHSNFFIPH